MHIFLLGVLLLITAGAQAASGLVTIESDHSVNKTMERLTAIVEDKGFRVFASIDHAAAAKKVDLKLRPTRLLIFGKPKAGTLLMQSSQSMAIDLPLKYLVWKDADGKVMIGWNAPADLAKRHGITDRGKLINKISGGLGMIAEKAAGK